jgi:hypothetical protein
LSSGHATLSDMSDPYGQPRYVQIPIESEQLSELRAMARGVRELHDRQATDAAAAREAARRAEKREIVMLILTTVSVIAAIVAAVAAVLVLVGT